MCKRKEKKWTTCRLTSSHCVWYSRWGSTFRCRSDLRSPVQKLSVVNAETIVGPACMSRYVAGCSCDEIIVMISINKWQSSSCGNSIPGGSSVLREGSFLNVAETPQNPIVKFPKRRLSNFKLSWRIGIILQHHVCSVGLRWQHCDDVFGWGKARMHQAESWLQTSSTMQIRYHVLSCALPSESSGESWRCSAEIHCCEPFTMFSHKYPAQHLTWPPNLDCQTGLSHVWD